MKDRPEKEWWWWEGLQGCVLRALCKERRTSGMLCWGSEQVKQVLICFFVSFLPKAYFRILRPRAGHKQTKNMKNKFSCGQSSEGVHKVLGLSLSTHDETLLGQSQLCPQASEQLSSYHGAQAC